MSTIPENEPVAPEENAEPAFVPKLTPITDQQRRENGTFAPDLTRHYPPVEAVPGVGGIPGVQPS